MSYQNDDFVDNCIMRLVQIAAAIRQNCERSEQNNDRMEKEFDAREEEFERSDKEIECQSFDACEVE